MSLFFLYIVFKTSGKNTLFNLYIAIPIRCTINYNILRSLKIGAVQARVQEFVRGGGPKSFFLLFNFSGGGGPAQKTAEKMIFSTKKVTFFWLFNF